MTKHLVLVVVISAALAACSKKQNEGPTTASGSAIGSGSAVATGASAAMPPADAMAPTPPGPVIDGPEPEPPPEDQPRPPGPDEIDRCARILTLTKACGVGHDYEFGWVKSDKKKLAAADAKKQCSPATHIDEDGMSAFPVPVLDLASVEKLEAAARKGCKAVTDTLDEVSPGVGPAGYDPSK
ncbi:MAG TPA: hypothetical protein VM261_26690 [Kofleriaceae bacterium]|nr:hypothetical protein [Kofleriaceae bacterium]